VSAVPLERDAEGRGHHRLVEPAVEDVTKPPSEPTPAAGPRRCGGVDPAARLNEAPTLSILTCVRLAYLALRNPYADSDVRDWSDGRSPGVVPRTDRQPRVPPRSFLSARRRACPLCTSLTHSQPGLADGPTRGSLTT